jgi:hypothetical protein
MMRLRPRPLPIILRSAAMAFLAALPLSTRAAPPDDDQFADFVAQQIAAWQPTPLERRLDQIGWAADIRHALRLAREHQRPVFLFTYDGQDLAGYRC